MNDTTTKPLRKFFPTAGLKFFGLFILFLICTALLAEQYMQRQTSAALATTSWQEEDARIKRNNLQKLGGLDEHFPLMATPGGIEPTKSGKKHRILLIADSFSWGDGLSNINDVWWRQTERELERRGYHDVEVIALGWNGAQTKEQLGWLRDARLDALHAEAIVMGFVVNDPDMGLLPQDYKVIRMFFADDVFRWWLPELTQQFQNRYMRKVQERKSHAKLAYANQEQWLAALLEGENYRLWQQTVMELGKELRKKNLPHLYITLPAWPDREYHNRYYDKAVPVLEKSGIPVLNVIDDFARDKGEDEKFPILWSANPVNGHPGVAATHYFAQKLVDWLEAHAPEVLGEKTPAQPVIPRANDWYPWKIQAKIDGQGLLRLQLPEFREMGFLPVGEAHVQVSFEKPLSLRQLSLEPVENGETGLKDILVSVVDANGAVERELRHCAGSDNGKTFTVPPLPKGARVHSIRLVPRRENTQLAVRLVCTE